MAKSVLVIWDDIYHPEGTYTDIVNKIFGNGKWDLKTTYLARDVFSGAGMPDLVVNFTIGCPEGEAGLTTEEQDKIKKMVEAGMNMMYVHAGLAVIQEDTPVYDISLGHFASHPQPHYVTHCCEIPGTDHPIMKGVEPFEDPDEHYFCKLQVEKATPFMASVSVAGTEIAGWTQVLGKGRVCSITPGHNAPMLAKMQKLLENAAAWCVGEI